jgi:hypothetical protein
MNLKSFNPKAIQPRTPSFGVGPRQSVDARLGREMLGTTQRELNALLRRVRARPEKPSMRTPPVSDQPPTDQVREEPAHPTRPGSGENDGHVERPMPAAASTSPKPATVPAVLAEDKSKAPIMLGIALAAFALLALALHLGAIDRISKIGNRVTAVEKHRQGLDELIAQRLATQDQRISQVAAHLDEVRHPSAPFKDAQDLMAAGRYMDAEAAYGALLASRPTSSLSPVIAGNSAIANAMLGQCSMVDARLAQLRAIKPKDTLLSRSAELAAECGRQRRIRNG